MSSIYHTLSFLYSESFSILTTILNQWIYSSFFHPQIPPWTPSICTPLLLKLTSWNNKLNQSFPFLHQLFPSTYCCQALAHSSMLPALPPLKLLLLWQTNVYQFVKPKGHRLVPDSQVWSCCFRPWRCLLLPETSCSFSSCECPAVLVFLTFLISPSLLLHGLFIFRFLFKCRGS